jgi:hypothetical protein
MMAPEAKERSNNLLIDSTVAGVGVRLSLQKDNYSAIFLFIDTSLSVALLFCCPIENSFVFSGVL